MAPCRQACSSHHQICYLDLFWFCIQYLSDSKKISMNTETACCLGCIRNSTQYEINIFSIKLSELGLVLVNVIHINPIWEKFLTLQGWRQIQNSTEASCKRAACRKVYANLLERYISKIYEYIHILISIRFYKVYDKLALLTFLESIC